MFKLQNERAIQRWFAGKGVYQDPPLPHARPSVRPHCTAFLHLSPAPKPKPKHGSVQVKVKVRSDQSSQSLLDETLITTYLRHKRSPFELSLSIRSQSESESGMTSPHTPTNHHLD